MTKKDYLALADKFRPFLNDLGSIDERAADALEACLVRAASRGNERFDKDKFLGYLRGTHGPNGKKKK